MKHHFFLLIKFYKEFNIPSRLIYFMTCIMESLLYLNIFKYKRILCYTFLFFTKYMRFVETVENHETKEMFSYSDIRLGGKIYIAFKLSFNALNIYFYLFVSLGQFIFIYELINYIFFIVFHYDIHLNKWGKIWNFIKILSVHNFNFCIIVH